MALTVSENRRFLMHDDGTPFFYLGDTAWELFHRLTRDEIRRYLVNRAAKGFTVIQAVVLAEMGGLRVPNREGHLPLLDNDPTSPNEPYFELVDFALDEAERHGLYLGILPTWGDKWCDAWGDGPVVFTAENARVYGEWLGRRYRGRSVIWVLGGDRPIRNDFERAVNQAMAAGIREAVGQSQLVTFHPMGVNSSSAFWPDEPWLDFHMIQSGHATRNTDNAQMVRDDYRRLPVKPVIDAEPRYEDHPIMAPDWSTADGYFGAWDVRRAAYQALFSGACGHTYGCHPVWQMCGGEIEPINRARNPWHVAMDLPGAAQMGFARRLIESRPFFTRVPGDAHTLHDSPIGALACRDEDGRYLMAYLPEGGDVRIVEKAIQGVGAAWWLDPATGIAVEADGEGPWWTSPTAGDEQDWVLVVDAKGTDYPCPGARG